MNTTPDFVHLHVHTHYNLLESTIKTQELLQITHDFGMSSVAVTNYANMFGAVEFFEKANKLGIKPILGCECYVVPRSLSDKTVFDKRGVSHLILLAENQEGYRNLCKLISIAHLKGFNLKPCIDLDILNEYSKGLIGLSGCSQGEIPRLIQNERTQQAEEAAYKYLKIFGGNNFFLELQNSGIDIQNKVNKSLIAMGQRLSIPIVATNNCHYIKKEDVKAYEVLLCIQTGKTICDSDRLKSITDQFYFKSKEEMYASFEEYPDALNNSINIVKRCNVEFDFKTYHIPKFSKDSEFLDNEIFEEDVRNGFARAFEKAKTKSPYTDKNTYFDRLEHEISIIKGMGFSSYFLIVADFIRYAKENNIPVGPGRGSVAGSLVAHSLGITDIDPLEHGLFFERFLNPVRKSMPDIDVDFCMNGREEVIKYVTNKYGGDDYVAQITTFGKLKSRAVIRDVGRALNIPLSEVDAIAKIVPDVLNIGFGDALEQEQRLRALAEKKPEVIELINICRVLEGLPRHASTHAAGVVIADKPLVEYLPLYKSQKGKIVTQFGFPAVEKMGLVKFDFLGLRNLTVIANTLALIARQGDTPPDLSNLDLSDSATYRLLASGDTTGVFQFESIGIKDLLVRLKPETFDEIIALGTLYRPGPLESGMVDDFVERKHGKRKIEYLVSQLEPILKETYGVIVYQEQIMKIATALANYSMAEADDLRRAFGMKKSEIMAKHKKRFIHGAAENDIPSDRAEKILALMEKFGGYVFNKAHSVAYTLTAFQTAYLKAHFGKEFMASLNAS